MQAVDESEARTRGWRILHSPPIRILVAALFVLLPAIGVQLALQATSIDARIFGPAVAVIAMVAYALYVRAIERRPIHEIQTRTMPGQLVAGIATGAAMFAATMLVLWLLGAAEIAAGQGWSALFLSLMGSIGAAFAEEILFRAVVFRILSEWLGDLAALAISAALFGLLHAGNPGATVVSSVAIALEAGILLGTAYMVTRQIWLPIGLHLAWNVTEGGVFGASVSGKEVPGLFSSHFEGDPLLTGGAFGPEASVVAVVVGLVAAALMFAVARRRSRGAG
jgi:membrane protease YdiL (CAAX protease family)